MEEKRKKEIKLISMLQILENTTFFRRNASIENELLKQWVESKISEYRKGFSDDLFNEIDDFVKENKEIIQMLLTCLTVQTQSLCQFQLPEKPIRVICNGGYV